LIKNKNKATREYNKSTKTCYFKPVLTK